MPDPLVQAMVSRMSPDEQSLRDRWNNPVPQGGALKMNFDGDLDVPPMPLPPGAFNPGPLVVPSLAKDYERFRKIAPNLDQKVGTIRHDVNEPTMETIVQAKYPDGEPFHAEDYKDLNLNGTADTGVENRNISINPRLKEHAEILPTLGHELTHIANPTGAHEDAYAVGSLIRKMIGEGQLYDPVTNHFNTQSPNLVNQLVQQLTARGIKATNAR